MGNHVRRVTWLVVAVAAISGFSWGAPQAQTTVQYDYDSLGRVCRARWTGGQTINYEYDANSNRRVVTQKTSGGVTNSAACPQVTATAAPASAARPRTNSAPTLPANLSVSLCGAAYGSPCTAQRVNVLRYAFDWDFQAVTVISTAMQSGPGTVAVAGDAKSIVVTPPSSAVPNGTTAQAIFTISDGNGGTATSYVNITYFSY